jgi:hypothetical protein
MFNIVVHAPSHVTKMVRCTNRGVITWSTSLLRERPFRLGRVGQNKRLKLLLAGQKHHAALVFVAISYFPSHVFSTSTAEVICPL